MKQIKSSLFIALCAAIFAPGLKAQAPAPVVTLDYYFNHEFHKDPTTGETVRFHYIWEEKDLNGYSNWGDAFIKYGAKLKSLETAPTAET
jgi:hypothetical protein